MWTVAAPQAPCKSFESDFDGIPSATIGINGGYTVYANMLSDLNLKWYLDKQFLSILPRVDRAGRDIMDCLA